ncbi:MAG: response regulator, partial [Anaerolineales bacterium]
EKIPERVLVVDEDPYVLDLLKREVLGPLGYEVEVAEDAGSAIRGAVNFGSDLIIASLTLPGLSGKDLLVALRSQGTEVPMLVTAPEGMEADAIQAFRLGARDYLVKPLRETEVVAAVERVINDIRLRHEHDRLTEQLADSNRMLERRVRELTTLFGLGKTVTSTTHQGQLFSKLMEGCLFVTSADLGWVVLQKESSDELVLRAERNLPPMEAKKLHQNWDDGVSSLVLLSGEALAIHGEGLSQFKLSEFGQAALIAPIKAKDRPFGVIGVARKQAIPFTEREQVMLEAITDYASISLVNARLFQALEERAKRLEQEFEKSDGRIYVDSEWLESLDRALRAALAETGNLIEQSRSGKLKKGLNTIKGDLETLLKQLSEIDTGEPE